MTRSSQTNVADLVRFSRDGDQFHYSWAARRCLKLLSSDLLAVTIEAASSADTANISGRILRKLQKQLTDGGSTLVLTQEDVERLTRYMHRYGEGGFQGRLDGVIGELSHLARVLGRLVTSPAAITPGHRLKRSRQVGVINRRSGKRASRELGTILLI